MTDPSSTCAEPRALSARLPLPAAPRTPTTRQRALGAAWATLLRALALVSLTAACGGDPAPVEGDVTAGADVAVTPVCSADSDCGATGDPCVLRRCSEGTCVVLDLSGQPCEDGEVCTVGDTCGDTGCTSGPNLCACSADSDCPAQPCAGQVTCDKSGFPHRCVVTPGTAKTCPSDSNPCTVEACDPSSGACTSTPANHGLGCSDGDACTQGDVCAAGVCKPGANSCACLKDSDCSQYDAAPAQGGLCAGKHFCDTSGPEPKCVINPATVVTCSTAKDTPCVKNTCEPTQGTCAMTPTPDGGDCTESGSCDQSACTKGACTPTGTNLCACTKDADCAKQEDGDLCNGTLYCNLKSGTCTVNPATVVHCPGVGNSACVKQVCLPASGACQLTAVEFLDSTCDPKDPSSCTWALKPPGSAPKLGACDDGDSCTQGDVCTQGLCKPGDTNTCACAKDSDCAKLEDGNLCNGTLFCNKQVGQCQLDPSTTVACFSADDSDCVKNACVPKTGKCVATHVELVETFCVALSNGGQQCRREVKAKADPAAKDVPCDDADKCTAGTTCKAGACQGGADVCKCLEDADCKDQDDGNLCNGLPYCDKPTGTCKTNLAKTVVCETVANTACMKVACHPKSGQCIPTAAAQAKKLCDAKTKLCHWEVKAPDEPQPLVSCDDGNACTASDTCVGGLCQSGQLTCACQVDADCESADDGDKCNGVFYCDKSGAKPACVFNKASVVNCGQQPLGGCTVKVCDPKSGVCGLQPTNEGKSCDDGEPCTAGDACKAGSCGGAPNPCDDGDKCTTDACVKGKGCVHSKANCDDGNACTLDVCDAKTGQCTLDTKALNGKGCDADGDPCTPVDTCGEGVCKAGAPVVCKLPTGACEEAKCAAAKGGTSFQCVVVTKADGADCGDGAGCTVGATCKAGTCAAGSKQRLLHTGRAPTGWQVHLAASAALPGGHTLAVGRGWKGGASKPSASMAWVTRFDRAGAAGKSAVLASPQPDPAAGAWAVALRDDGDALVVGALRAAGVGLNARLVRYDPVAAKVVWDKQVGTQTQDEVAQAVALLPGGGVVVAGWRQAAGGARQPWLTQLTATGAFVWEATPWAGAGEVVAVRGPATSGGVVTALGRAGTSARLVTRLANGKPGPLAATLQLTGGLVPRALAPDLVTSGGWLVVGETLVNGAPRPVWLRTSGSGQVSWSRVGEVHGSVGAALAHPGGWWLAGSTNPSGGNDDAWLTAVDGLGNRQWQRSVDGGSGDAVRGLTLATDGDLALVGRRTDSQGQETGLIARTDAFGHSSCAAAGPCVGKKLSECADGKPCTADDCAATQGCTHKSDDDYACHPNDGCSTAGQCSKGACKPAGKGKLFVTGHAHTPAWHFVGLTRVAGGGLATLAHQDDYAGSTPRKVWFVRLSEAGALLSATPVFTHAGKLSGVSPVRAQALMQRADGGFVVGLGQGDTDGEKYVPRLLGLSATGQVQWTQKPTSTACSYGVVRRLAAYPNGDLLDVRTCPGGYGGRVHSLVMRRKASGEGVWDAHKVARYTVSYADVGLLDGRVVGTDTTWAVGAIWGGTPEDKAKKNAYVAALDGKGGRLWSRVFTEKASSELAALAVTQGGQIVAAGWRAQAEVRRAYVVGLDAKGQVQWTQGSDAGPASQIRALVALKDGALMASGTRQQGLLGQPWLARLSPGGEQERAQLFELGLLATPSRHGLVPLADDTVVVSGTASVKGAPQGLLARADRWGHVSCGESAGCLLKTGAGCSDKDPCTLDTCTASGCVHAPAPCSDGDPCTTDSCNKGQGCVHKAACDDGDPCTVDACDTLAGCTHLAVAGCAQSDPCKVATCSKTSCAGEVANGACYTALLGGLGYRDKALAACEAQGTTLLSIHDAATNLFAIRLASEVVGKVSGVWTGLYKANATSPWIWLDGTPVDYSNTSLYKPLLATDAKYSAEAAYIGSAGYWNVGNAKTSAVAMPVCIGLPKATCTVGAAPDGTACGSGKACQSGVCK